MILVSKLQIIKSSEVVKVDPSLFAELAGMSGEKRALIFMKMHGHVVERLLDEGYTHQKATAMATAALRTPEGLYDD